MNYAETHDDEDKLEGYYRWHSHIYDATRWSFLFGREKLLLSLPDLPPEPRILEIGCGTGRNIERLEQLFPDAQITGIDLSRAMLEKASQRLDIGNHIELLHTRYGDEPFKPGPVDLILLSYSLTMMRTDIENKLQNISKHMRSNGYIATVDFNKSPHLWFEKWMQANHVQMDGSLLPLLKKYFKPVETSVHSAYFGLWSYFMFIGQRG